MTTEAPEKENKTKAKKEKTLQDKNAEFNAQQSEKSLLAEIEECLADPVTIDKVRRRGKTVEIKSSFIENDHKYENTNKTNDLPSESFTNALNALSAHMAAIVNVDPKEQERQAKLMEITGVSFKYHGDLNVHASITAWRNHDSGKGWTFTFPLTPLTNAEGSASYFYTPEAAQVLIAVIHEARSYLNGRRLSQNIFENQNN